MHFSDLLEREFRQFNFDQPMPSYSLANESIQLKMFTYFSEYSINSEILRLIVVLILAQ